MKCWTVGEKNPEGAHRPFYVSAETAEEAVAKVEALAGVMPRDYIKVTEIDAESVPEGEDML